MITLPRILGLLGGLSLLGFRLGGPPPVSLDPTLPQRIRMIGAKPTPGGGDVTSLTILIPAGGVPVGRRLVARLATGVEAGPVSASDSRGNTWTVDADHADEALVVRAVVLSAHVNLPLAQGQSITVQFPKVQNAALIVEEYSGVAPSNAVDRKGGKSGVSATASSATVTTSGPNELLIGHIATRGNHNSVTFQAGSGWTTGPRQQGNTRWALAMHRIASAPGSFAASGTLGVSTNWASVIVAYRPAEQPVRLDPDAPPPTTTDLTLLVGKPVLNAPVQWVTEYTIPEPVPLDFRWTRPAARAGASTSIRGALAEKAQWQMVAGSNPTTAVAFLPSSQVGPSGLPAYALYSYGSIALAASGSTGTFTITADRVPAKPLGETVWVRVVLSEVGRLRAAPWVKISIPAPKIIVAVAPEPVPLSITLAEIECVRETDDASPEDEISVAVMSADLLTGGVRVVFTNIYDFDEDDSKLDRKWPNLGVWGPKGEYPTALPRPISSPDAAVVIAELIEHDGSGVPAFAHQAVSATMIQKLADLKKANLPHAEIIKQLRSSFRSSVKSLITDPTDSELFGTGWHATGTVPASVWDFTSIELQQARSGEVVERVLTFETTQPDEIIPTVGGALDLGDDSEYKLRFRMSKPDVSTR